MVTARLILLAAIPLVAGAQKFYTYVGQLDAHSVTLAWGTTTGSGNTIGRASASHGKASIQFGDRTLTADRNNWVFVEGLTPDTEYSYEVKINNQRIGAGKVRTWLEKSDRLVFFVMGDYGNGSAAQQALAGRMAEEFDKRAGSGNPVRFVATTGDNIYADSMFGVRLGNSGDKDNDWDSKFFEPYGRILAHIPFYPTLGNHDGNTTESRGDLDVYLDNFFFPGGHPARYYNFSYGGLAEFFALDSTDNTEKGPAVPAYTKEGPEFRWMTQVLRQSHTPWKICYLHHPLFTAGPLHSPGLTAFRHFADLFQASGVQVVFSGHEHNFQFSQRDSATGGILYVISGAGGELRSGNALPQMRAAHMAGWAPARHFLIVEIEGRTMRITPFADKPIRVIGPDGKQVGLPIVVTLPQV